MGHQIISPMSLLQSSFKHSFTHSFIKQTSIQHLLHARRSSRNSGCVSEENRHQSPSRGFAVLGRVRGKNENEPQTRRTRKLHCTFCWEVTTLHNGEQGDWVQETEDGQRGRWRFKQDGRVALVVKVTSEKDLSAVRETPGVPTRKAILTSLSL